MKKIHVFVFVVLCILACVCTARQQASTPTLTPTPISGSFLVSSWEEAVVLTNVIDKKLDTGLYGNYYWGLVVR